MPYQYGEAFARVGIPGMGRQGAPWCALREDGVLFLMAHMNYFHRNASGYFYELPERPATLVRTGSAAASLDLLEQIFSINRPIHLLIGEFSDDGGLDANGTLRPARFRAATGHAYEAMMRSFNRATSHLVCDNLRKYAY